MTAHEASEAVRAYALAQVGGPYIYGATAKPCTIGYRNQRADQYPQYANNIESNCPALSGKGAGCVGCQYEGRLAHDCAQLTRYAAKAAGLTLPSGASSQWNKADWDASGEIATMPSCAICFVYRRSGSKMQHTGIYLGDGTVVDARSHAKGVVHMTFDAYGWTHWAILRGMEVPEGLPAPGEKVNEADAMEAVQTTPPEDRPMLRNGSSGAAVRLLQTVLRKCGYSLDIDGKFGPMTLQAVMTYQGTHGLKRDGVVGPLTWTELDATAGQAPQVWTVTIPGLTEAMARVIIGEHGGRMEAGGGDEYGYIDH